MSIPLKVSVKAGDSASQFRNEKEKLPLGASAAFAVASHKNKVFSTDCNCCSTQNEGKICFSFLNLFLLFSYNKVSFYSLG